MGTIKNLIAFVGVAFLPLCAQAVIIGYVEGGTANNTADTGDLGYSFTVTSSIQVTALGFNGISLGGGDQAQVHLYDVTASLELANSGNALYGSFSGWQYATLGTPVTLTPGNTYQVFAPAYWAPHYADDSGFTFGPEITTVGWFRTPGFFANGGWSATGPATAPSDPYAIPNFQYDVMSTVPEPSTVGMLLIGAGVIAAKRKRVMKLISR